MGQLHPALTVHVECLRMQPAQSDSHSIPSLSKDLLSAATGPGGGRPTTGPVPALDSFRHPHPAPAEALSHAGSRASLRSPLHPQRLAQGQSQSEEAGTGAQGTGSKQQEGAPDRPELLRRPSLGRGLYPGPLIPGTEGWDRAVRDGDRGLQFGV